MNQWISIVPSKVDRAKRARCRGRRLRLESLESRRLLAATLAVNSGDWDVPGTWSNGVPTTTKRAIISQGKTVTLNSTNHVAQEVVVHGQESIDLRAEVALLSRSITIQGTQDTDSNFGNRAKYGTTSEKNLGVGAHAMFMNGSGQITIDSVQFDKMGQTGIVGRYPIHWHLGADRDGDVLRNSSVTNSNNRGVTVHGTQVFERFLSSSAYWITNPDNVWVGNISAGSEGTGFWFILGDRHLRNYLPRG